MNASILPEALKGGVSMHLLDIVVPAHLVLASTSGKLE